MELSTTLGQDQFMEPANQQVARSLSLTLVIPYDVYYQPFTIRSIQFANHLASRGHRVTLFHRPQRESKRRNQVHFAPLGPFALKPFGGPLDRVGLRELRAAIAASDVVHVQKASPSSAIPSLVLSRLEGKPVHYDWDDDDLAFCTEALFDSLRASEQGLGARFGSMVKALGGVVTVGTLEWLFPSLVDTLGGASIALRRKAVLRGARPGCVFPARVGVDSDIFSPARRDEALRRSLGLDGPTVLFSGYFDRHSDLRFFVEAVKSMAAIAPEARCLVLGDGSGRAKLVQLVRDAGLLKVVQFSAGFVPHLEMPRYIASCDIAALPLRNTPRNRAKSPLTLVECMACGLPVVTNDVGDAAWMLGGGGEVATLDDPRDFGSRLGLMARDPEKRAKLGARARARAEECFGWARSVDFLVDAYCRSLQK